MYPVAPAIIAVPFLDAVEEVIVDEDDDDDDDDDIVIDRENPSVVKERKARKVKAMRIVEGLIFGVDIGQESRGYRALR